MHGLLPNLSQSVAYSSVSCCNPQLHRSATVCRSQAQPSQLPWQLANYYTKKKERRTNPNGEVVQDYELLAEPLGWQARKFAFAVQAVSRERQADEDEVWLAVQQLHTLIPDLSRASCPLKAADLVRLAVEVPDIAHKLMALKELLPTANVSLIAAGKPQLLRQSVADLKASVVELLGPDATPGPLLEAVPQLLDPAVLRSVLDEISRLFGSSHNPVKLLVANPELASMCQSLQQQSRGDRDLEYLGDITAA